MNARKTLILASALSLLVVAVLEAAQPAEDTSAGTWKLNIAKSAFASDTPPKSETRTYTVRPDGTHVVIEDQYADGKKTKVETLITYDGRPQPSAGSGIFDSIATRRIDRNTTTAEVIGTVRREVSPDGKTVRMFYVINRPDGRSVSTLSVFERR